MYFHKKSWEKYWAKVAWMPQYIPSFPKKSRQHMECVEVVPGTVHVLQFRTTYEFMKKKKNKQTHKQIQNT